MYAVIVSGGKQYRVSQGDVIYVEKLDQEVDSKVSFDVLMLGSDEGVEAAYEEAEARANASGLPPRRRAQPSADATAAQMMVASERA